MDFLVARDDLHRCRIAEGPALRPGDGQAVLRIDSFGLTSNNITYAMFGEAMSYWGFFPGPEGWGRVPVWGFAEVGESRVEQLREGARVYGYLPPSSELLVTPSHVEERGFIDRSAHRSALPAAYNAYAAVASDPVYDPATEDEQMLLRPLFFTSYLIDDFLAENDFFGAGAVILSSASSKTANALAFLLARQDGIEVIGLTSSRSAAFTRSIGVYDHVIAYDELGDLPPGRSVYVDMSGDGEVRRAVHECYRDELAHSAVVGATHHDRLTQVPDALPGPRPTFFFAPDRVAKRGAEWGREGFERRLADAWGPYVTWAGGWLRVQHAAGGAAIEAAYLDLLDNRIDPATAHVLTPSN